MVYEGLGICWWMPATCTNVSWSKSPRRYVRACARVCTDVPCEMLVGTRMVGSENSIIDLFNLDLLFRHCLYIFVDVHTCFPLQRFWLRHSFPQANGQPKKAAKTENGLEPQSIIADLEREPSTWSLVILYFLHFLMFVGRSVQECLQ